MVRVNVQRAWDEQDRVIDAMYKLIPVNVEQHSVGYKTMAETFDIGASSMARLQQVLQEIGVLRSRVTWKQSTTGGTEKGKEGHWTLLVEKDEATRRLRQYRAKLEQEMDAASHAPRKPKPPAEHGRGAVVPDGLVPAERQAVRSPSNGASAPPAPSSQLVASTGPDPASPLAALLGPMRKDESYALVEAGRQYAGRKQTLEQHIHDLYSEGISLRGSLTIEDVFAFEKDERLETVGLVLPYITQLERMVEKMSTHASTQRARLRQLESDNEGLRRELRRTRPSVEPTVVHAER